MPPGNHFLTVRRGNVLKPGIVAVGETFPRRETCPRRQSFPMSADVQTFLTVATWKRFGVGTRADEKRFHVETFPRRRFPKRFDVGKRSRQ